MWFKQVHILKLTKPIPSSAQDLSERLAAVKFKPCLPSMATSLGWIPPIDEDEETSLVLAANNCLMLCLQIEEKILPASVVNHALKEQSKKIEANEGRKLRQKEKLNLKDEIIFTLLQRAFSRYSLVYAYIDSINNWLVINTTTPARVEQFVTLFKKTLGDIVEGIDIIKPSSLLTHWLQNKNYPTEFAIEKACVLKDPEQQNRMIRAQHQDLFASSIQSLLKDGCEVVQIALCWQDRLKFVIAEDFSLRSIQLAEEDLIEIQEALETKRQRLTADLVMMTQMYTELFKDLMSVFVAKKKLAEAG